MKRGAQIREFLGVAVLATLAVLSSLCTAQKTAPHPMPQRQVSAPQQHISGPQAATPRPQRHIGDWLRRYKDLPPDEVERELKNDPAFQQLPPGRQQVLVRRMQHFASLPPDKQLQMLNRQETWEHLTPEQQQQALQVFHQMQQLPPDRQRMVRTAVRNLRSMPPDQREKIIDSDRFKSMFSDQERELMRGVTHLPLAPAEPGEETAPQESNP
jgi:hypothetical protein